MPKQRVVEYCEACGDDENKLRKVTYRCVRVMPNKYICKKCCEECCINSICEDGRFESSGA